MVALTLQDLEEGDQVRVERGKYKGDKARVVKKCKVKVNLQVFEGQHVGTSTCLKPDQLVKIVPPPVVSSNEEGAQEPRPAVAQPEPVPSLVTSHTVATVSSASVETSNRETAAPPSVTTSRSLPQPQQHTNSSSTVVTSMPSSNPTPPALEESQEADNPWAVQGAYRPDYHQELGLAIGLIQLEAPGQKSSRKRTMAYKIFGDRLLHFEIPMGCAESSVQKFRDPHFPPKVYETPHGRTYELLCTDLKQGRQGGDIPTMKIWIQYVLISGPDISTIHVQQELDKVADFGSQGIQTAAARIKLLNSPAVSCNRKDQDFYMFDLDTSDFEIIEDSNYHGYDKSMGCGYIPRHYLDRFLGTWAIGKRTSDIQIRIWSPALGVFKGMLTEKQGIDKIQLVPSMKKLEPSRTNQSAQHVCLILSGVGLHPTRTNWYVGNIISGGPEPPETFVPKKLGFMLQTLWRQCGVSEETIQSYVQKSRKAKGVGLEHANLVGVPDPTDSIPPGMAFIPGFERVETDCVVVNKYPSCGARDAKLLKLLKTKPDTMSQVDWDFLRGQHFGKIVFGTPETTNTPPIPAELGVDMDGDLYFICWNKHVVAECTPEVSESWPRGDDDQPVVAQEYNPNWFTEARELFFDLRTMVNFSLLIKALHKAWKKEHSGEERDLDKADFFGRAFKKSLDMEKHGKKVYLPKSLWTAIPKNLHGLLCETEHVETLHLVVTPSGVRAQQDTDQEIPATMPAPARPTSSLSQEDDTGPAIVSDYEEEEEEDIDDEEDDDDEWYDIMSVDSVPIHSEERHVFAARAAREPREIQGENQPELAHRAVVDGAGGHNAAGAEFAQAVQGLMHFMEQQQQMMQAALQQQQQQHQQQMQAVQQAAAEQVAAAQAAARQAAVAAAAARSAGGARGVAAAAVPVSVPFSSPEASPSWAGFDDVADDIYFDAFDPEESLGPSTLY